LLIIQQRSFFEWIADDLGLESHYDWYFVHKSEIFERGGAALLNAYYNMSLSRALNTILPGKVI
jgi:hypothetical protein